MSGTPENISSTQGYYSAFYISRSEAEKNILLTLLHCEKRLSLAPIRIWLFNLPKWKTQSKYIAKTTCYIFSLLSNVCYTMQTKEVTSWDCYNSATKLFNFKTKSTHWLSEYVKNSVHSWVREMLKLLKLVCLHCSGHNLNKHTNILEQCGAANRA